MRYRKNGIAHSTARNLKTVYLWNFYFHYNNLQQYNLEVPAILRFQYFPHLTKFKKQNALPCKFQKTNKQKNSKGCCFIVSLSISDHRYLWSRKTLSELSKSILKPGSFFIKFLTKFVWKLEKIKKSEFQKVYMFDDQVIVNTAFP